MKNTTGRRWRVIWRFRVGPVWSDWHLCMSSPHRPDAEAYRNTLEARSKLWMDRDYEIQFIDAQDEIGRKSRLLSDPGRYAALSG